MGSREELHGCKGSPPLKRSLPHKSKPRFFDRKSHGSCRLLPSDHRQQEFGASYSESVFKFHMRAPQDKCCCLATGINRGGVDTLKVIQASNLKTSITTQEAKNSGSLRSCSSWQPPGIASFDLSLRQALHSTKLLYESLASRTCNISSQVNMILQDKELKRMALIGGFNLATERVYHISDLLQELGTI
ncbi:hypothetical protein PIB30_055889 [Stylosanthes scabra]|uniref:Uncharacterized protein n=1 Tax=Stylosanthes scabra TaxID=79078 RepID=A0ABU6YGM4_9FABA|nr:hypothetical protein [Stylosanthes scabra]